MSAALNFSFNNGPGWLIVFMNSRVKTVKEAGQKRVHQQGHQSFTHSKMSGSGSRLLFTNL
jgi:hypothetical protein